jgi:PEP-CTERM motif
MYLQHCYWDVSPTVWEEKAVKRKVFGSLCLVVLASMAAVAGSIQFNGSGSSGSIDPGQPFSYNFDGTSPEPNWGVPGVGGTLTTWSGPTIDQFTINFDLPTGITIDPMNIGDTCNGGPTGGTVFCASPYSQPWNVTLSMADTSITFTALPGGDLLMNGDTFFVNIFFTGGDPNGASFNGDWVSPVPEPSGIVLFGSGVLGLAGAFRRKLLL